MNGVALDYLIRMEGRVRRGICLAGEFALNGFLFCIGTHIKRIILLYSKTHDYCFPKKCHLLFFFFARSF